jgi:hypothetical protein
MSLYSIFQWINDSGFATYLRESSWTFPIILATHLTGMALFGGMILMTDMRILGLVMREVPVSDVVNQLRVWKRVGGVMVIGCGIMLASSKAEAYYHNPYFWAKMTFLTLIVIHALVFRGPVYNNAAAIDRAPAIPTIAKVAACISVFLWVGMVSMGRLIAYYEGYH